MTRTFLAVTVRSVVFLLALIVFLPAVSQGGGPLRVNNAGEPYRWRGDIVLKLDPRPMGNISNADARNLIQGAINEWKNVSHTILPEITIDPVPLSGNITASNTSSLLNPNDGITPVILDSDGSIIHSLCPPTLPFCENSIAGLANFSGDNGDSGPTITEGNIILSGKYIWGNTDDALRYQIAASAVHELGHLLGLGHSQLNLSASPDRDLDTLNDVGLPSMFPFLHNDATTLHRDDQAAVVALYPGPTSSSLATIQGKILIRKDGQEWPFQGANVVVRKVTGSSDEKGRPIGSEVEAVGVVSGARFLAGAAGSPSNLAGLYEAKGLPPGNYIVFIEPIDPVLGDMSGIGPLSPPASLPAHSEYYNKDDESEKPTDRPDDRVSVSVQAGVVAQEIDILLNLRPDPIPISTEIHAQVFPEVAFDGSNYLVVWRDTRSCSTPLSSTECEHDIFGARVTPDGKVLDPGGFLISAMQGSKYMPKVSFGGGRYLVVWGNTSLNESSAPAYGIYGTFVDPDPSSIAPNVSMPFPIAAMQSRLAIRPDVAFDGSNFMVIFITGLIGSNGIVQVWDVQATRVTQGGDVLDNPYLRIFGDRVHTISPNIAFGGGYYLVQHGGSLVAVKPDGSIPDHDHQLGGNLRHRHWWRIPDSMTREAVMSDIAFGGGQFLVVWDSVNLESPQEDERIFGGFIPLSEVFPDVDPKWVQPFEIPKTNTTNVGGVRVAWDGTQFVVVWGRWEPGPLYVADHDIVGARVLPPQPGAPSQPGVRDANDLEIMTDMEGQLYPALAFGNGKALVVWHDLRKFRVDPHYDIYGQLMTFPGLMAVPEKLSFTAEEGGSPPAVQNLLLVDPTHATSTPTQWHISSKPPWLAVSLEAGSTPFDLTVTVNHAGLSVGKNEGEIVFEIGESSTGPTLKVPVTLEVLGPPVLTAVSPLQSEWEISGPGPHLMVKVMRGNEPAAGVQVEWTDLQSIFSDTPTATNGVHTLPITHLPDEPRSYVVTATCAVCVPTSISFTVTAIEIQLTWENPENPSVLPRGLGGSHSLGESQRKVEVKVLPVEYEHSKNREVTLKVIKAEGGGHDSEHVAPRPTGSVTKSPALADIPDRSACLTLVSVNTDPDDPLSPMVLESPKARGKIVTDIGTAIAGGVYTACEIGGTETIEASIELMDYTATGTSTKNGRMIKKEKEIKVEVPGLIELGTNTFYRLTGTETDLGKKHLMNHFGTNRTVGGVILAVAMYFSSTQLVPSATNSNQTTTATNIKLGINDMSLIQGGKFDDGTWVGQAHGSHRKGTSADIDTQHLVPGRGYLFLTDDNQFSFKEKVIAAGLTLRFELPENPNLECNPRTRSDTSPCFMHIEFRK